MRKNHINLTMLGLIGSAFATQSYALVDLEVSGGQRSQKVIYDTVSEANKTKTVTGSEINASVLFDPIPVIPVSFGLTFQSSSVNRDKVDQAILDDSVSSQDYEDFVDTTASGKTTTVLYGPMIKVWAPTPFVKPYLKFAYLTGSGVNTIDMEIQSKTGVEPAILNTTKGDMKFSHTGTDLDLGLEFSPAKLVSIFFEYAIHTGKSKVNDQSIESVSTSNSETSTTSMTKDDLTDEDKKAVQANATSIRVGLSVGF